MLSTYSNRMTSQLEPLIAGKIYAVLAPNLFKCYIGSTRQEHLYNRMKVHRHRKILPDADAKIILVENYPCKTILELHKREAMWIKAMGDFCINRRTEGITSGLSVKETNAIHHAITNPLRPKEHNHCDCGGAYGYSDRQRHFRTQRHQKHLKSSSVLQVIRHDV